MCSYNLDLYSLYFLFFVVVVEISVVGEGGVASVLCREAVGQEQSSVTVNGGINREDCELQLQECSNTPIITVVFS